MADLYHRVCKYDWCERKFTTAHPRKIYCRVKCQQAASRARITALSMKLFGVSYTSYIRGKSQKQNPIRPRRRTIGATSNRSFSLPIRLVERMKKFPHTNWSAVITEIIEQHCDRLERD